MLSGSLACRMIALGRGAGQCGNSSVIWRELLQPKDTGVTS